MTLILDPMHIRKSSDQDVQDVTSQSLNTDVLEASMKQLVLLCFWSPTHPQSTQLITLLSSARTRHDQAFKVTRIRVDQAPEVAQAMGIRALPTVVAFVSGRPVDAFSGVPEEADLERFLARFLEPRDTTTPALLKEAERALTEGRYTEAHELFLKILTSQPDHGEALLGLVRCALELGDVTQAEGLFSSMPLELQKTTAYESVKAAFPIFKEVMTLTPTNAEETDVGKALIALKEGRREDALKALLLGIEKDPHDPDHPCRVMLLKLFAYYGASHPLTMVYRRAFSRIVFA